MISQASASSLHASGMTTATTSSTSWKDSSFCLPRRYLTAAVVRNDCYQDQSELSDGSIGLLLGYNDGGSTRRRSAPASSPSVDRGRRRRIGGDDVSSSGDEDDASSGSFLFDDRRGTMTPSVDGKDHLKKEERMLFDFSETLSNLESLGFAADVTDDDADDCDGGVVSHLF